ncbi:uncharacterized protein EV420DRAFT_1585393 [Desarmillaria tabescens]|uniref:Uncharacterized protein n=1 Tax=Armillaria tabescens TaxID=1929756 RepID=A0AA39JBC2_ARMTA|nr:uncharacterized protein EV420DRAFT_1585393 [Desarmillaria tabescens]KAK0438855.1 hypothetical protein EV420DRAFT_1585393 [Desarmillaria tabescens]
MPQSSQQVSGPSAPTISLCTTFTSPQVPAFQEVDDDSDLIQAARSLNSDQVVKDAAELMESFEEGFSLGHGHGDECDEDEAGDVEIGEAETSEECSDNVARARATSSIGTTSFQPSAAAQATGWADEYILQTRRKSGQVTEQAVIAQWKQWIPQAIHDGLVHNDIQGAPKQTNKRLSASSLKKIMTMLGRVHGRQEDDNPDLKHSRPAANSRTVEFYKAIMIQAQRHHLQTEDFDIAKNTILDQELQPDQFSEITAAIFSQNQVPTIIKSHFAWTWQATTLNRGDEVINLPMSCLQPYHVNIPDFRFSNGQVSENGALLQLRFT